MIAATNCEAAITAYWPAETRATALAVARVESGLRADNHNFSHRTKDDSWGCFQVNLYGNLKYSRPPAEWLLNPVNNTKYAIGIYKASGFCSTASWYNTSVKLGLCK